MRHETDSGYYSTGSTDALSQFSHKHNSHEHGATTSRPPLPSPEENGKSVRYQIRTSPYFTRDGRYQIPLYEADSIAERLKGRGTGNYVDLHQFAIEQDISYESLERLVHAYAKADFPRVIIDVDAKSYLCTDVFAEDVKATIRKAATAAGPGICDLTAAFGDHMPAQIIVALATEATDGLVGGIHLMGDHVIWAQSCNSCFARDEAYITARDEQIADIVNRISEDGFCILPEAKAKGTEPRADDDLEEAAILAFSQANPHDARPQVVYTIPYHAVAETPVPKAKVLVKPRILKEELEMMRLAAVHRAELLWQDDSCSEEPYDIVRQLEPSDYHTRHKDELSQILLRSAYLAELESAVRERTRELERHRYDEFTSLVETRLWCPLHLYAAGIIEAEDHTLKRDFEDSALAQFRSEHIPETVATIQQRKVLQDEQRAAAIVHLEEASQKVHSFAELQVAVAEAGRELQIESPHENLVLQVKHKSLKTSVTRMAEMTRGLDILQNLIWVLLATSGPGLFIGSVKYTRKMVQQYDLVGGDPEISGLLMLWWDKVRDGIFTPDDLRQMRELAKGAVEMWREEKW